MPPWVHLVGGLGFAAAGATISATQECPAGRYVVLDIESGTIAPFELTAGKDAAELPVPAARIHATDYASGP